MATNQSNAMPPVNLELPYPDIAVAEQNPVYARMILDNYGGANSEMTAVSSYMFSGLALIPQEEELAEIFDEISYVEMQHLNIFGQLSLMLGIEPRLWTTSNDRMQYWTPCYTVFPTNLSDIVDISITSEKQAIQKYNSQMREISDEFIKEILARIILDEERHIQVLEWIRNKYILKII